MGRSSRVGPHHVVPRTIGSTGSRCVGSRAVALSSDGPGQIGFRPHKPSRRMGEGERVVASGALDDDEAPLLQLAQEGPEAGEAQPRLHGTGGRVAEVPDVVDGEGPAVGKEGGAGRDIVLCRRREDGHEGDGEGGRADGPT